ncbi:MAG: hypothetical protein Q8K27_00960, partial [Betaproteobacteria bacterium]|nr:hypothetical protein [Betaproteobacteria bacterium]
MKAKPRWSCLYRNRVFATDALLIRSESSIGAQSAQWRNSSMDGHLRADRAAALALASKPNHGGRVLFFQLADKA